MTLIEECLEEYFARKYRRKGPEGVLDTKLLKGSRMLVWYPSKAEQQSCCAKIKGPSADYPDNFYTHCCTLKHVAMSFGIPYRKAYKALLNVYKDEKEVQRFKENLNKLGRTK
jgi:hypothetical protein